MAKESLVTITGCFGCEEDLSHQQHINKADLGRRQLVTGDSNYCAAGYTHAPAWMARAAVGFITRRFIIIKVVLVSGTGLLASILSRANRF